MNKLIFTFLLFFTFNAYATTGLQALEGLQFFVLVVIPISVFLIVFICTVVYRAIFSSKKLEESHENRKSEEMDEENIKQQ